MATAADRYYHEPTVHAAVVAAVRTAFVRSRTSPRGWAHRLDEGRLDPRNVWRQQATARTDIFRDRLAPGATKVNVHILVDGSGSMTSADQHNEDGSSASRIEKAIDIAATLTDAFRGQPRSGSTSGCTTPPRSLARSRCGPSSPTVRADRTSATWLRAVGGGNGDGYAIKWVGEKVRRSHRKGEVDLLIIVSDGLPSWLSSNRDLGRYNYQTGSYDGVGNNGVALVFNAVQELRERGTRVLSIAITPNDNFAEMYGEDNVIPFTGDWAELAVNIGKALGDTLAAAARDPKTAKR